MKNITVLFIIMMAGITEVSSAACPGADINGDCRVDLEDFAIMAQQWLTEGIPEPANMVFVSVDAPGLDNHEGFSGQISKYETTNAQYCQFLDTALTNNLIKVHSNIVYCANDPNCTQPYLKLYSANCFDSQILFSSGSFSVRSRDGKSMASHPVVMVSYYGAKAFCDFYSYYLPSRWQWQAVAHFDNNFIYACGNTISPTLANYKNTNPLSLSGKPYTSPVDYYPSFGYGISAMAGNAWEWTSSSIIDNNKTYYYAAGGSWSSPFDHCKVSSEYATAPDNCNSSLGFRVCR